MKYLIYQNWKNTGNNHAGIKYLCLFLENSYPTEFISISLPDFHNNKLGKSSNFLIKLIAIVVNFIYKLQRVHSLNIIGKKLRSKIQHNDRVFLMEYMDTSVDAIVIANKLKKSGAQLYGMSHLVPEKLNKMFSKVKLQKWVNNIDGIITLGHSLVEYYHNKGISKDKLFQTFHYVDAYYYSDHIEEHSDYNVIVMGNQMRDNEMLIKVIKKTPEINYIICQGWGMTFKQMNPLNNVRLLPYIPENILKETMKSADVSLNIMYDTIGSNVIVTSMAMGLAMICSDVGSIRNYCTYDNCIFCRSEDDFVQAIRLLKNNKVQLMQMRTASVHRARKFSIQNFYKDMKQKKLF